MKSDDIKNDTVNRNHLFIYLSEVDENVIIRGTKRGLTQLLRLVKMAIGSMPVLPIHSFIPQDGESFDIFINPMPAEEVLRSRPNAYTISREDRLINGDITIKQIIDNETGNVKTALISGMYMGKPNLVTDFDFSIHNIGLTDLSVEIKDRFASEYYGLSKMLKYLATDHDDSRIRNLLLWYKGIMKELYGDYLLYQNSHNHGEGTSPNVSDIVKKNLINIDNDGSWHGDFVFNMTPHALRKLHNALTRAIYNNNKGLSILSLYNATCKPTQITIRMVKENVFFTRGTNYLVNNSSEQKNKTDDSRTFRVIASYYANSGLMDFYLANNSFCIKL